MAIYYNSLDVRWYMFNPIEYFIRLFWPKDNTLSKEIAVKYRVILYFNFFGIVVMLYSIIKWAKLDYSNLVYSSVIGIIIIILASFFIRQNFTQFLPLILLYLACTLMAWIWFLAWVEFIQHIYFGCLLLYASPIY